MNKVIQQEKMEDLYFDFQAEIGITKHMGALDATNRLLEIGKINSESIVLDIGCGVGFTPIYISRKFGCKVYAVDLRESMIKCSKSNSDKAGLKDAIYFRVADAVDLPFEDNMFDIVLMESVNAFIENKAAAFKEYHRILKVGGRLIINEATWKKEPPEDVRAYMDTFMNNGEILLPEDWSDFLRKAKFKNVTHEVNPVDMRAESASRIKHYGWKTLLSAWGKTFKLWFTNKDYRKFLKAAIGTSSSGILEYMDYLSYGFYSGEK